jgi:hypothetical protein
MRTSFLALSALSLSLFAAVASAEPRVDLELITEKGFAIDGAQEWVEVLKSVGASGIRIRSAEPGDEGGIVTGGTAKAPSYKVTGVLTSGGVLRLPGGQFRLHDKAGISAWIHKLKEGGEEGLTAKVGVFGLTSKQLVAMHEGLASPVGFSTKGKPAGQVVRQIAGNLKKVSVVVDPSAEKALGGDETTPDELSGVASGTALAAALRPLGLVAVPLPPRGSELRLGIADSRAVKESWPVGWPPEKPPRETMPHLFEFLNVEIADTPLPEALDAIQERLKSPFLYDHNSLARHKVDMSAVKVKVPAGKTYYKGILDRMLAQSRPQLKCEIRVDEAGQPLLWITTVKQ